MKTTLELPDALLLEAKAVALRQRTTLRAIIERALRRELAPTTAVNPDPEKFEVGPFGILSLKKRDQPLTTSDIRYLIDHQHDEEDAKTISPFLQKP